ncbi:MAG: hypothetical protein ACYC8V_10690 [Caulobacteraceae bacterium]
MPQITIAAPDTVVLQGEKTMMLPAGTGVHEITWSIAHVQPRSTASIEVTARAGRFIQLGLCKVVS